MTRPSHRTLDGAGPVLTLCIQLFVLFGLLALAFAALVCGRPSLLPSGAPDEWVKLIGLGWVVLLLGVTILGARDRRTERRGPRSDVAGVARSSSAAATAAGSGPSPSPLREATHFRFAGD